MWTILAFVRGGLTCLTIFVVGAVIGGGRDDDDYLDAAALEGDLSEFVKRQNAGGQYDHS